MTATTASPPPRAPHLVVGAAGEDAAADFLTAAGMVVLSRNWRFQGEFKGELDIVARDGATLVVVEVKTRRTAQYGSPALAVGKVKAMQLRRLAVAWLGEHATSEPWCRGADVRFDVVAVVLDRSGSAVVEHLPGVLS